MSREELSAFLDVAREEEPRLSPLSLALARAGLRPGAGLGLQRDDLDFPSRRIRVERALSAGRVETPKTGQGRSVDMSRELTQVLLGLELDRTAEALRRGWGEPPVWVFCSLAGTPLDLANVEKAFKRCLRKASMASFRLYDLRHTFASQLLAVGTPITYVAAQLGHARPTTTLQWYARWLPTDDKRLVDTLDGMAFRASGSRLVANASGAAFAAPQVVGMLGAPRRNRTSNLLIKSPQQVPPEQRSDDLTDTRTEPEDGGGVR